MELSEELNRRMEEAANDKAWVEKISAAAAWEEYAALLGEKGIEAPMELKEVFDASRAKSGELADDELEMVSGGWKPEGGFPKQVYKFCQKYIVPLIED